MEKKRILIIDDEASFTRMVKLNLEKTDSMKTKAACTKAVMDSYDFMISAVKGFDLKKALEYSKKKN